ncbi:flagellar FliJ family protein [Frigoribacterium sp. PvP032]|uniref:flagellar FliJ family protein n=1 Tax=Frigoribacterium sp. PvP032 TaxID=2806589 RepID=UPI001AE387A8|nr:flagellar FliJ family protein [Frigoribacterium sp. PvP032]MBP1191992.1 flagellar export protein FliJ [Frigoribacterium sp. PvP032]
MARTFSLLGLLRLRHAQQDQAAGRLAEANDRLRDAADRRLAAKRTLDDGPAQVTDAAMLSAIAASRASSRGMLAELDAVTARRRAEADEAQAEFQAARRAAIGLEKLEAAHAVEAAAEDLRTEQAALDEIAGQSWRVREAEAAASSTAAAAAADAARPAGTPTPTPTPGGAQ